MIQKMTQYLRSTLVAGNIPCIPYENQSFIALSWSEISSGQIDLKQGTDKEEKKAFLPNMQGWQYKKCVIALRTTMPVYDEASIVSNGMEKMSSFLFLPVKIDAEGRIYVNEKDMKPWIPREYLSPMVNAELTVSEVSKQDEFLSITEKEREAICASGSWRDYFKYAKRFSEEVIGISLEKTEWMLGERAIKLDSRYYMIEYERAGETIVKSIKGLYDDISVKSRKAGELYKNLISIKKNPVKSKLQKNTVENMKKHVGQMGGEYPLSVSQREAINHFSIMRKGEILAVNGPPGTGKTTMLQSMIANMLVEAALKKSNPPVIVAASTNNAAVCNIIDSLEKIKPVFSDSTEQIGCLEKRWIKEVKGFALYFLSSGEKKLEEAKNKGYQFIAYKNEEFEEKLKENLNASKEFFLKNSLCYYDKKMMIPTSDNLIEKWLKSIQDTIYQDLKDLDDSRRAFLVDYNRLIHILGKKSNCAAYETELDNALSEKEWNYQIISDGIECTENELSQCKNRLLEWETWYTNLPWIYRKLSGLSFIQKILEKKIKKFISVQEEAEICICSRQGWTMEKIRKIYSDKQGELYHRKTEELKAKKDAGEEVTEIKKQKKIYTQVKEQLIKNRVFDCLSETEAENLFSKPDLEKTNDILDRTRYREFWLAVHYFECEWILQMIEDPKCDSKIQDKNDLQKKYQKLALLTPCFVMTLYHLPTPFKLKTKGENVANEYLYQFIDLLIIDEGGQTTLEVAAASFALAKKAVVVGDIYQISPIYSTSRRLDMSLALEKKIIESEEQYNKLEKCGLNCANTSVMLTASYACCYEKDGEKGLFLCEHRRCYDEIIGFCNELIYQGRLVPMRGKSKSDSVLPAMGHREIPTDVSARVNGSRVNEKEAAGISEWLSKNFKAICSWYDKTDEKMILGIITPFKKQADLIEQKLSNHGLAGKIKVGTVHTFQGSERNVIIFSTVYGSTETCHFIKDNKNLLNVAVSRAKDSFLVFGADCLGDDESKASGLLKSMTACVCPEEIPEEDKSVEFKKLELPEFVIVDTETTGLGADDEVIELSVVSMKGDYTSNKRIYPSRGDENGVQKDERKPTQIQMVSPLLEQKKSISEIEQLTQLSRQQICSVIQRILKTENKAITYYLLSEEREAVITAAVASLSNWNCRLKPVKEILPEYIEYYEIDIAICKNDLREMC